MGAQSRKVWELVHSLTQGENQKFYERAFQHRRGRYSYYVTLYEVLKDMEEFDGKELLSRLQDQPFVSYIHRVKNYLYDRILVYVLENGSDGERLLSEQIQQIKFLFEKRLYHHISPMLGKAEKLAEDLEDLEDFKAHLKILQFQRELSQVGKNWETNTNLGLQIGKKEQEIYEKEGERIKLIRFKDEIWTPYPKPSDEEGLEKFRTEIEGLWPVQSKSSEILYHRIRYNYFFAKGEYSGCLKEAHNIVNAFRSKPSLIQEYTNFKSYLSAVHFGANWHVYFNEFDKAKSFFGQINGFSNAEEREPIMYLELRFQHELALAIQSLDFQALQLVVKEIEDLPRDKTRKITPAIRVEILHMAVVGLIIAQDYKKSLKFINELITSKPRLIREDFKNFARLLFILTHYELGNFDTVDQGIKAAKIGYKRKNLVTPFSTAIFKLYSALIKSPPGNPPKEIFEEFLSHFSGEHKTLFDSQCHYFNFEGWAVSKLEKRPFTEILAEGFQANSKSP